MRMWLCDPKILCQKHLCGCHLEMHMFIGSIKKGIRIDGYLKNNLIEPLKLKIYHDLLVEEMIIRGYNHKSDISETDFNIIFNLPENQINWKMNIESSLNDLLERCPECQKNYVNMVVVE